MQHFSPTTVQILISVFAVSLYFMISRRLAPILATVVSRSRLKADLHKRAQVVTHILLALLLVVVLSVVWGVDIRGLLVLASSMIAVIGVALFAAWSLLSNITAFFILLGQKAFAEGMEVRVVDGGNYLEGRIVEINLFSTVLRTKDNEQVIYPNNLLISRPVIVFIRKKVAKRTPIPSQKKRSVGAVKVLAVRVSSDFSVTAVFSAATFGSSLGFTTNNDNKRRLNALKTDRASSGFKSFVDSTSVPFPQQMTAVVGPNGCGKSNVIDAVRWVLGESSAKNLRGDAMTDVIFNGSSQRKPVSQASVELMFENTQGRLAGGMADRSEISIRRVVTRDAQSLYFLNGTKCRRRDITDIFLGTGLGPRSYAIIEQGMISPAC